MNSIGNFVGLVVAALGATLAIFFYAKRRQKQKIEERMASAPQRFAEFDAAPIEPLQDHNLNLQNEEHCYFREPATLYGYKTVRGSVGYHGPVVRIPITKGVTYRAAILSGVGEMQQEIRPLAEGEVYLTNKRVIFRGDKKNNSIYLNKILEFMYFYGDDSIRIDKDNGPPIILHGFNCERMWYLYERILSDQFDAIETT